ncbi:hypothetical protein F4818DRAFT_441806 [Hypoxylon cercidicola]|nr:hypothetical protein F4818DRAFT_441806 [Hypoxylon cercidicola]
MASWGHQKINNNNIFGPDKLRACSSSSKRPTCQEVASSLGVNYQKDPPASAQKAAEAAVAVTEDYFAGMTEEQMQEFLSPSSTITPPPTLEQRDLTITKDLGPSTTNKKLCQVCTRVVNNEDSCHSMKDCIVQAGKVTIEAGTSSVHVGTLTGSALYTSVSSALDKICPTPTSSGFTSCKTDPVSIGKIPYVSLDFLSRDSKLQVSVESSKYNVSPKGTRDSGDIKQWRVDNTKETHGALWNAAALAIRVGPQTCWLLLESG